MPAAEHRRGVRAGSALAGIYAHRFPDAQPHHLEWRRAVWRVLVDAFFSRWIPPTAAVLDFGCGRGEFINAVRARRRIAVDARGEVTTSLDPGVEFWEVAGGRMPAVSDHEVDVVFCSNVLEHLADRPAVTALLMEFRRVLRPDGRLLVLGPNLRYTGPAYWDFFDHVLPFTHLSLVEALASAGFEVETLIPRFLPYTTVGARRTPPMMVRWYLRLPFLWHILGAQFFAVARAGASAR
jgi:SAM-dependent methyltransferase